MTVAAMASIPEAMDELSGRYDAGSETIVKSLLLAGKYHEVGKAPAAPEIFAGKLDFENDPAAAKKATIVLLKKLSGQFGEDIDSGATLDAVKYYEERWDGEGPVYGITADQVPLAAYLLGIANMTDAVMMKRGASEEAFDFAASYIESQSGRAFSPRSVELFGLAKDRIKAMYLEKWLGTRYEIENREAPAGKSAPEKTISASITPEGREMTGKEEKTAIFKALKPQSSMEAAEEPKPADREPEEFKRKRGAHRVFGAIWNALTTILVTAVVILAICLVGVRIFGLTPFTILSGSMEPMYPVGSLIYVKEVDPESVEVGDSITFVLNADLVVATHQVWEIDEENGCFYTQGIANIAEDGSIIHDASPVLFENLIGKPVFCIPYLGYFANYVTTAPGMYIAIAAAVIIIMMTFIPDILRKADEADKRDAAIKAARRDGGQNQ